MASTEKAYKKCKVEGDQAVCVLCSGIVTILRHFGNMFGSSLNTEISRSVLSIEQEGKTEDAFRGTSESQKGGLSSLKKDGWSPYY
ncbi:hypothetical protein TNCV_240551 [Trichonephila clavipes]|nr:hypothetical protein TNCV_240551 [Trichonephila clavipes]